MGAAVLQRFVVPVQIRPQNSGQEHTIPDPPSDDNEIFEVEIPAIQLDNTGCNILAVFYCNNKLGVLDNFYKNIYVLFVYKLLKVFLWGQHFRDLPRAALYLVTPLLVLQKLNSFNRLYIRIWKYRFFYLKILILASSRVADLK